MGDIYIYALMEDQLVLYVGKTRNLKERERLHRSKSNNSCSKYIPAHCNWEMVWIDTAPEDKATIWEQYYFDTLCPLYNKCRPGQTLAESMSIWRENNKDYHRQWRLKKKVQWSDSV